MIEVKNLTKIYQSPIKSGNVFKDFFARKYKTKAALEGVSFTIDQDELVGFIGPNGAGKTTTMKILTGILYPTSGEVKVMGYTPFEKKHSFLRSIAFVMGQKNQLLWDLPALDTFNLNKEIYEIPEASFKKHLSDLIELLDCKSFVTQPVKTLSLGQRMRVELIAALLHQPKVLFLDEPTIGLDVFAQSVITDFIKEYQERYKSIIMLTSHYMKDIQRLAKRVILIDHGKVIYDGKLESLVHTFSQDKTLRVTLRKPLSPELLKEHKEYHYQFPLLTVTLKKEDLVAYLEKTLKKIDYTDFTLEDEPIEEVIKKVFTSK